MSALWPGVTPEMVEEVRQLSERPLSPEAFEAYVSAPMSAEERDEIDAQIAWFMRRYPTPAERLSWARRAYAAWSTSLPASARPRRAPR